MSEPRRPGRPRGEVRAALAAALAAVAPATSHELMRHACTGRRATTVTLSNMVIAGEVAKIDYTRSPGVRRPVPVYALAAPQPAPGADLAALLRGAWR